MWAVMVVPCFTGAEMTGQQPDDVAEHRDGFELRRYPAHLVAEIEVAGSFDEAPIRAFGPAATLCGS